MLKYSFYKENYILFLRYLINILFIWKIKEMPFRIFCRGLSSRVQNHICFTFLLENLEFSLKKKQQYDFSLGILETNESFTIVFLVFWRDLFGSLGKFG